MTPKLPLPKATVGYLGWANGWKDTPEIVRRCREMKHKRQEYHLGRTPMDHTHLITCEDCGYWYKVDSS